MQSSYAQKSDTVQKASTNTVESVVDSSSQSATLQRHALLADGTVQRASLPPRPNNTGMPDNLKSGIESLSGFSMDDVRVHYNSSKPATVQALAYTQGMDIHVAPGQEKCLPHEAWHVAQQMAGRVSPTTNINGIPVNDNAALEHEADVMGEKAVQCVKTKSVSCLKGCVNAGYLQRMPLIKDLTKYNIENADKVGIKSPVLRNGATIELKNNQYANVADKVSALDAIIGEAITLGKIELDKKNDEFFNAVIGAKYKTRGIGGPVRDVCLKLKYQFRAKGFSPEDLENGKVGGPGYIVEVSKDKKNGGERDAKMINGTTTVGNQYSNKHDKKNTDSVIDGTYKERNKDGKKVDESFKGSVPDAYTKLAGEGARFQCVRRNMRWIRNDTVFYKSKDNPKDNPKGVMFSELWKTWSASFGNAYNIDDDKIVTQMGTGNTLFINKEEGIKTRECVATPGNCVLLDGSSTVFSEFVKNPKNVNEKLESLGFSFDKSPKWKCSDNLFFEISIPLLNKMKKIDNLNQLKNQLLRFFADTYKIDISIPDDPILVSALYKMITRDGVPVDLKKQALTEVGKATIKQTLNPRGTEEEKRVYRNKMLNPLWTPVLKSTELHENVMKELIKDRIIEIVENSKGGEIFLRRFRNDFIGKCANKEIALKVYHEMLNRNALTIKYGIDDDGPAVLQPIIAKGPERIIFLTA